MHRHLELADAAQAQQTAHTIQQNSRFSSELGWGSRYRLVRSPLAQGQHERLVGPHRLACLLLGTVGTPDHIVGVEQVAVDDLDDGEG